MKLMSVVTCVKNREKAPKEISSPKTTTRPSSDGVIYGNFNERRIEYEDVILTETSDSQYSQSESYLSERLVKLLLLFNIAFLTINPPNLNRGIYGRGGVCLLHCSWLESNQLIGHQLIGQQLIGRM